MSGPPAQGYKISGEGVAGGGSDGTAGGNTVSLSLVFFSERIFFQTADCIRVIATVAALSRKQSKSIVWTTARDCRNVAKQL